LPPVRSQARLRIPTGAIVLGAKVTVLSKATSQATTVETNDLGYFAVRSLPPGTYKVTVESKTSAHSLWRTRFLLPKIRPCGLKLELGQIGDTIQVEGGAH